MLFTKGSKTDHSFRSANKISSLEKLEVSYDAGATQLFIFLQEKQWTKALNQAEKNNHEAWTWVSRQDIETGHLRWRMLPLHAAFIFGADDEVVKTLLSLYPRATSQRDDQGMLPIHLALRNNASEDVINEMIRINPSSLVNGLDGKNREPYMLIKPHTQNSEEMSLLRNYLIDIINEREDVIKDLNLRLDNTSMELTEYEMKLKASSKNRTQDTEIKSLKNQLKKEREKSAVLVSELERRKNVENELQTEIKNLKRKLQQFGLRENTTPKQLCDKENALKDTKNSSNNLHLLSGGGDNNKRTQDYQRQLNDAMDDLKAATSANKVNVKRLEKIFSLVEAHYPKEEKHCQNEQQYLFKSPPLIDKFDYIVSKLEKDHKVKQNLTNQHQNKKLLSELKVENQNFKVLIRNQTKYIERMMTMYPGLSTEEGMGQEKTHEVNNIFTDEDTVVSLENCLKKLNESIELQEKRNKDLLRQVSAEKAVTKIILKEQKDKIDDMKRQLEHQVSENRNLRESLETAKTARKNLVDFQNTAIDDIKLRLREREMRLRGKVNKQCEHSKPLQLLEQN